MAFGRVSILGGGMSGLSAAYYYALRRPETPLVLYESSKRVGGWINSENFKEKGFILEAGPRTIRPKGIPGANTLALIEDLELPIDVIKSSHAAARNRMIFAKGKLCMLPISIGSMFKTIPPFSKPLISALFKDLRAEKKQLEIPDESIYDFAERRFGSDIAKYAISPLICGICAGDAREISVRFLMEDLFKMEQKYGGVTKGIFLSKLYGDKSVHENAGIFGDKMPPLYEEAKRERWSMYRIRGGLENLPRKLKKYLSQQDVDLQLDSECRSIRFANGKALIEVNGETLETEHVISALPSHRLASCLRVQHPSLSSELDAIPYVDVAVVNLVYRNNKILNEDAFGFLVPPVERLPILGVIFDSCCFDMRGNTVLTVMMGGKWFESNFGRNPTKEQLLGTALQQLGKILGIKQEPMISKVHILEKCIPQYTIGHKNRIASIRSYIERNNLPLSLCGASYDGVGINDVILSARNQVEMLVG